MELLPNGAVLLTRAEFDALLNYSTTLPTGTTPGKSWRKAAWPRHQEVNDEWWRGTYGKPYPEGHEHHGEIPIGWRRIVVAGVPARWPREVRVD